MGVQLVCILGLFALQSLAMLNATTICDYEDCTCIGETVSCRCQRNTDFKLTDAYKTVPSKLSNFSIDQCNSVTISGGIFHGSNIANIDIRNCIHVTVETSGMAGLVLKHLGFHNLTLRLESDSVNGNITSMQFESVNFTKSYSSSYSIGGRFDQLISFVNCVSGGMGFFNHSLKVGEFLIENSTIDRIEQHNLKFDVMYNLVIKNSHIGHIEEGGIWPGWQVENWHGHRDVILMNNRIGVLENDFFNANGWRGRFKFFYNIVQLMKEGAFRPYYMEHINEIHIWNNSFAKVEPYDITIVLDYNKLFISGNQFYCNSDMCTTLDQSVPVVKEFDVYSYYELLMFNNSQCIDEPHRYQTPADVYGHFFDATECLESFGSNPEYITVEYNCTEYNSQCSCFNHEAICTCNETVNNYVMPNFTAFPQNISRVTITDCPLVYLYSLRSDIFSSVEHVIVKNVADVYIYYFLFTFEQLKTLKFKNVNISREFAFGGGAPVNYGGVLTLDNVNTSILATGTFDSANSFGRVKVLNSNIGLVQPHAFDGNGALRSMIFFNTTIANVSDSGFCYKYLDHFRMGFCRLENVSQIGFNITYNRQVQSIEIRSSSFGLISERAFFSSDETNLTHIVRKVVFSDNTVDVLRPNAFYNLWQNSSAELEFTNNTIYRLGRQRRTVSGHRTVVKHNWLHCGVRLCGTLAKYFPYYERKSSDDFFALLAFNQSKCTTASFYDVTPKSVVDVYGRFRNASQCYQHFRNRTIG